MSSSNYNAVSSQAASESTPAIPLMMSSMGTTFAPITTVGSIGMIPIMSTPTPTPTTTMFPGSITTPGGAFTPYPSAWAQFAADPANAQALQGYQQKYQDNCIKRKKFTYLNTVGQREKETLTQFLTRWRDEVDKVEEMDDKTAMSLLMNAFRSGDLYTEFCRRPPSSYQEAYNTAWEYAEAEVQNKNKRELEEGYTKSKSDKLKKDEQTGGSKLKATYDGSIHQIRDDKKGEQPKRQWTEKWCTYHQSDSHNTADCRNVKAVLKEMALKGELGEGYATVAKFYDCTMFPLPSHELLILSMDEQGKVTNPPL
ncbi:unnamed protein product [Cuscuta campestris]|uniref:Retrotransposon gag domain-containing protein n=1 Tax=Cuscuta campestris TaxID=132261 RepID=A0A484NNX8_9ASTE|nr:unnamed protein product [Cuscuta campestris]